MNGRSDESVRNVLVSYVKNIAVTPSGKSGVMALLTAVLPKERVCHSEARPPRRFFDLRAEESHCGAAGTARFFASLKMTISWPPYL